MNSVSLTSKQIIRRALDGLDIPRPATGPLAVHYCARQTGVSLREFTLNPRVLAECVVRYYEKFRPDAVWLSADTWVTAQAMGSPVAFPGDDQPLAGTGEPLVRTRADVDRIPPPDPGSQGRWPIMLEALQLINEALGNNAFIVACFDQYPFSLACALMGIEQVMIKLCDDRSLVQRLMQKCGEYTLAYALALAAVGADMLSGGDSPAGLLGPKLYREVALPFEMQVISEIRSRVELPVSLHICGDSTPILADMAGSGADVLELDCQVDIASACRIVGAGVTIWGNLDTVGLLAQGSPKDIEQATRALLGAVKACGHRRFVLSSGCTLAPDTPPENLQAMLGIVLRSNRDS